MSGPAPHEPDIDPVTGYGTTGHEWNGIRELNTPFPRIVVAALVLTFAYSVVTWVLLPAWPVGRDYTRGLLGLDQQVVATERYRRLTEERADWTRPFASGDFPALAADSELMAHAMPAAARLFADNCAACHGSDGTGGPGFPSLADGTWLWDGAPEAIAETLRVGINSPHPDTRFGQMPAFGRDGMLQREDIAAVTDHVLALSSGQADPASAGAAIFADNCASCHGDDGAGGLGIGAPSLADDHWIYGGSRDAILTTLRDGRQGVMPSWEGRLDDAEINMLALYVAALSAAASTGGGQ
ncbi:cytochrome-c oxidase, cbb3-type subunit III [Microbaculum marinisediminis]|uniref:Cbb3-type cytochrome c oxidase subunit n=1 Tax=Microbaculum marinisediminis TaxID=2931392 RepID=A0AAW5QZM0_9HYPH|nr:cytochrome-c oxidase, cbb3-type subunit III [Microbaculum sp. A6E488]MCT8973496.1 cytochrome-c oxidase, cbb3-type subunit III [Microbaculum sp. A6E488]